MEMVKASLPNTMLVKEEVNQNKLKKKKSSYQSSYLTAELCLILVHNIL